MSKAGKDLTKGMKNAIAHIQGRKPARRLHSFSVAEAPPASKIIPLRYAERDWIA
jgi:hypothetical protein